MEYKKVYTRVHKKYPMNRELEKIKRDYINGRKSLDKTIKRIEGLENRLTEPL